MHLCLLQVHRRQLKHHLANASTGCVGQGSHMPSWVSDPVGKGETQILLICEPFILLFTFQCLSLCQLDLHFAGCNNFP